jgi:hypothetical protein
VGRPGSSLTHFYLEMNIQWLSRFVTEVQGCFTVLEANAICSWRRGNATLLFTVFSATTHGCLSHPFPWVHDTHSSSDCSCRFKEVLS